MSQRRSRPRQWNSSSLSFGPKTMLLGAGALVLYGLTRRSKVGVALASAGGILAFKAAQTKQSPFEHTKATFLVNVQQQEAYDLWRNFSNLPRFMAHLKSVHVLDDRRSEWVVNGPMDREIRWNAEIMEDQPGQRIAWRSLADSDVQTSGSVEFRDDPQQRGTFVTAEVSYRLPVGPLAKAFATIFGKHPEFVIREDLRRFKALLEAGETPTTAGQPHGPRGIHGHTGQLLFRETSNITPPQSETWAAKTA